MNRKQAQILRKSDAEILEIARRLRTSAYAMLSTMRYKTKSEDDERREAGLPLIHRNPNAFHVPFLQYLLFYFQPLDAADMPPEEIAKIPPVTTFHEWGESFKKQDDLFCFKTEDMRLLEMRAGLQELDKLPEPIRSIGKKNLTSYYTLDGPAARFVAAGDKLEPAFHLLDPVTEECQARNKVTWEMYQCKYGRLEPYPCMLRFGQVIGRDLQRRGVFYRPPVKIAAE